MQTKTHLYRLRKGSKDVSVSPIWIIGIEIIEANKLCSKSKWKQISFENNIFMFISLQLRVSLFLVICAQTRAFFYMQRRINSISISGNLLNFSCSHRQTDSFFIEFIWHTSNNVSIVFRLRQTINALLSFGFLFSFECFFLFVSLCVFYLFFFFFYCDNRHWQPKTIGNQVARPINSTYYRV